MAYVGVVAAMAVLRLIFARDTDRDRRIFSTLTLVLLLFFAACRAPSVGRDTASFIDVFLKLRGRGLLDILRFSSWTEPGFRLLCALVGLFTANGQWLIAVTSLLIHGSVARFICRHSRNIYLSFFLYVTLMIYPFYFSMMRQALAVAVWLFAYGFLKKRKLVPYLLLVLLAASFHTSALLFLVCPLLALVRVDRQGLRILLPLTVGLSLAGALFAEPAVHLVTRLIPRYANYEVTTFDALYWYFAVFVLITGYGIFKLYYVRSDVPPVATDGFDEKSFLTVMMLLGTVVAATMTRFGQLERLFNYFEVLYLLWLPMVISPAFYRKGERRLAFPVELIVTLLLSLAYFIVILFFRSGLWYDAMPYTFFW
ncbi:MAG: EpsG family protein [Ruminococcaceae bacterium]|nr:EpsG family protein [Oscillospiraceae bacterium]